MLSNNELLALVCDTNKRDSWREDALKQLIENLAVKQLLTVVRDTDRKDAWRKQALDALCEIACLGTSAVSMQSHSLSVGGATVEVSTLRVSVDVPAISAQAARHLYDLVNDTDRKDAWRYQCLQYLIRIQHNEYLKSIADNTDRKTSWRDEAMRALIRG